jgi:PIN domain nuclease of toxin-antitoxin system
MSRVLDTSAVLAYLLDEEGARRVTDAIASGSALVHAVNLCEVYYNLLRFHDEILVETIIADLQDSGVVTIEDLSLPLIRIAAQLKAQGNIALGDVFALALAMREGVPVLTSDRSEFSAFAASGRVLVEFIR